MRFGYFASLVIIGPALVSAGCGTYVPPIREFPGTANDETLLIQAIADSVRCQIELAVKYLVAEEKSAATQNRVRYYDWFERWGVQYALTLTVEEKSSASPNLVWSPPSPMSTIFTIGAGARVSAAATRQVTMNFFDTVEDILTQPECTPRKKLKFDAQSLLITGDLGLRIPLVSYAFIIGTKAGKAILDTKTPFENEAFTDNVKFQIVTGGSINPTWELSRLEIDSETALFAASRDRTHELLITYGPIDRATKRLATTASNTFLASQISAAIGRNDR